MGRFSFLEVAERLMNEKYTNLLFIPIPATNCISCSLKVIHARVFRRWKCDRNPNTSKIRRFDNLGFRAFGSSIHEGIVQVEKVVGTVGFTSIRGYEDEHNFNNSVTQLLSKVWKKGSIWVFVLRTKFLQFLFLIFDWKFGFWV